jgi:threonine dehydrogenase-like Zn-dependent dehydrogenase
MRGAILYGPHDVRFEQRDEPKVVKPTDAVIRLAATCVCGSDLWPYRGLQPVPAPAPFGHEYCGTVEEVGSAVRKVKPGQFVVGSFFASDNTCPNCQAGYQTSCQQRELVAGAQAGRLRVPLADGTLVATPSTPSDELIPSLLAASDVLGTGWFAADAANVKPGKTVVVVGDGAVGLLGVLSAKQMGASRIVAMSRHERRQKLAREYGATDIVTERGDEGVARIKEMTNNVGRRLGAGVRGHARVDDASDPVGASGRLRQLRGRAAWRAARRRRAVLLARPPARRSRAGAPVPAAADRADLEPSDQSRQGFRSEAAARTGRRGLSRDGRAPRHQSAAAAVARRKAVRIEPLFRAQYAAR